MMKNLLFFVYGGIVIIQYMMYVNACTGQSASRDLYKCYHEKYEESLQENYRLRSKINLCVGN